MQSQFIFSYYCLPLICDTFPVKIVFLFTSFVYVPHLTVKFSILDY